jgi:hypothetical protein
LYNFQHIIVPKTNFITGGCEFSPSGRFLYINTDTSLFQLDLASEDIQGSLTLVANFDGFGDPLPAVFFFMERTPDKRILMNVLNGSQYLHVIQKPDERGIACQFEQHAIKLPTINNFTLPYFPNYRLGAIGEELCDSITAIYDKLNDPWKFGVFPNPSMNYLNIVTPISLKFLEIFDYAGTLVYRKDGNAEDFISVDISLLPNGIYLIRGRGSNGVIMNEQFIVQR